MTATISPYTDIVPFTKYKDTSSRLFIIIDKADESYPHPQVIAGTEEGKPFHGAVWLLEVATEKKTQLTLPEFRRYVDEGKMRRAA